MGYIPTEWVTGDIITAEKLNKAEQGIAGAYSSMYFLVGWDENGNLNKTYKQIDDAMASGIPVILYGENDGGGHLMQFAIETTAGHGTYNVRFADLTAGNYSSVIFSYSTTSEDGYPELEDIEL